MKTANVLLIGTEVNSDLLEALFERGFAPIVRRRIQPSLHELRHDRFGAIFIDRNNAEDDMLELILNIRDVDQQIPIVVVGKSAIKERDRHLRQQGRAFVVSKSEFSRSLANMTRSAFGRAGEQNERARGND